MAENATSPAPSTAKPCFTIAKDDAGDWIARERASGTERHFASQGEALHFALFKCGDRATALVTPPA